MDPLTALAAIASAASAATEPTKRGEGSSAGVEHSKPARGGSAASHLVRPFRVVSSDASRTTESNFEGMEQSKASCPPRKPVEKQKKERESSVASCVGPEDTPSGTPFGMPLPARPSFPTVPPLPSLNGEIHCDQHGCNHDGTARPPVLVTSSETSSPIKHNDDEDSAVVVPEADSLTLASTSGMGECRIVCNTKRMSVVDESPSPSPAFGPIAEPASCAQPAPTPIPTRRASGPAVVLATIPDVAESVEASDRAQGDISQPSTSPVAAIAVMTAAVSAPMPAVVSASAKTVVPGPRSALVTLSAPVTESKMKTRAKRNVLATNASVSGLETCSGGRPKRASAAAARMYLQRAMKYPFGADVAPRTKRGLCPAEMLVPRKQQRKMDTKRKGTECSVIKAGNGQRTGLLALERTGKLRHALFVASSFSGEAGAPAGDAENDDHDDDTDDFGSVGSVCDDALDVGHEGDGNPQEDDGGNDGKNPQEDDNGEREEDEGTGEDSPGSGEDDGEDGHVGGEGNEEEESGDGSEREQNDRSDEEDNDDEDEGEVEDKGCCRRSDGSLRPERIAPNSRILVDYRGKPYRATVRKHRLSRKSGSHEFLVHYDGNKWTNVHWITLDKICEVVDSYSCGSSRIDGAGKSNEDNEGRYMVQSGCDQEEKASGTPSTRKEKRIKNSSYHSVKGKIGSASHSSDANGIHGAAAELEPKPSKKFAPGSDVYVEYNSFLYLATTRKTRISRRREGAPRVEYLVHYVGYKKRSDKWVDESVLHCITVASTRRFNQQRAVEGVAEEQSDAQDVGGRTSGSGDHNWKRRRRNGPGHEEGEEASAAGSNNRSKKMRRQTSRNETKGHGRFLSNGSNGNKGSGNGGRRRKRGETLRVRHNVRDSVSVGADEGEEKKLKGLDLSAITSGVAFLPGSCVFVHWGGKLFLAKMLKRRYRCGETEYRVHYNGFRDSEDAWVSLSDVYEINPKTRKIFDEGEKKRNSGQRGRVSSISDEGRASGSRAFNGRKRPKSAPAAAQASCKFTGYLGMGDIDSGVDFLPGSTLFVRMKSELCLAKMLKRRGDDDGMEYFVQYLGTKRHADAWVPVSRVYEINPQTKRVFHRQKQR